MSITVFGDIYGNLINPANTEILSNTTTPPPATENQEILPNAAAPRPPADHDVEIVPNVNITAPDPAPLEQPPQPLRTPPLETKNCRPSRARSPRPRASVAAPPAQAIRPRPRQHRRFRHTERHPLPSIHDDPEFWHKVLHLPRRLLPIVTPIFNISTTCQSLRDIILYFNPGHSIPLRTRKADLLRLFQDFVVCPFGKVYGI